MRHVPSQSVPLRPGLTLKVYGVKRAVDIGQSMEQGYAIFVDGKAIARCDLVDMDRLLVREHLSRNFPEHTRIV